MATAKKATAKKSTAKKSTAKKSTAKKSGATKTLARGERVAWGTPQGETHGTVERKLTRPTQIKGHRVAASAENPEYLVRSETSGKPAARPASSLRRAR